MTIDMNQFFQVFFDEAEELLAEMERLLLAVDLQSPDSEDLNAIFRTAHSIKGGAATFGLNDLTEVTHMLESLLDKIRNGQVQLTSKHVDAFLVAKDVLKMQLDGHRRGTTVDRSAVTRTLVVLAGLSSTHTEERASGAVDKSSLIHVQRANSVHLYKLEFPVLPERDVVALAQELALLGEVVQSKLADGRASFELKTIEDTDAILAICSFIMEPADLKITEQPVVTDILSTSDIERKKQEVEQGYGFFEPFQPIDEGLGARVPELELMRSVTGDAGVKSQLGDDKPDLVQREIEKTHSSHESGSIRVGIEKVDQLINLVGELVITQAMIEQRVSGLDSSTHERLLDGINQLTRNTRDLQEAVMSIRMMPMDYVFSRFPRMVRDLASKLGKKVELVTYGAATELDKGLIERIVDPLTHLVRNSIDHGIESPDIRATSGKNVTGKLSLSASHQGGNIVIEVSDDGAGLNRAKILLKAHEKNLPIADDASDTDVWQLIFAPGFSTADHVTDVSGRGVGMDVVKQNIAAMGGVIEIRSSHGFGTTISISLPLTLAILDGMSIRIGDEVYILPLSYVVESLQPTVTDIKNISGQGSVIKVRGDYLPLIQLYQVFDIAPRFTNPTDGIVIILESSGKKAALFVDELVGQQQVVVKNLESNYRKVAGISGATILGDGCVSLIVDVAALLRSNRQFKDEPIFS